MFVTREMAGIGESSGITNQVKSNKSGEILLGELENIPIISNTGLIERRNLIRSWTTEELIRAHTTLHSRITLTGSISYADRVLLEAMKKEGIEEGGHHARRIQPSENICIPHGQGLTTTGSNGDTVAGFTKVAVWKLIKSA